MTDKYQAIRGFNDVLPEETVIWQRMEDTLRALFDSYGYGEIRLPILEQTELFKRSIGEVTDIVEKEMYTFQDRKNKSLTLRPEATASCMRAGIGNGLFHNATQKLWYSGPMFRYERPQKGRYRQFYQVGCEAIGFDGPEVDAEMILLAARFWKLLGIKDIRLEINSLGTAEARSNYRNVLVSYFEEFRDQLDEDSERRLSTNPLRILDSKNPAMKSLIDGAPSILDNLDDASREHFDSLKNLLDAAGVPYRVNPRLVRGLDYYTRTVFEWVTDALGAQGAVLSGGRYDLLVELLGGKATPAVGWAMGMERLVELYRATGGRGRDITPHVYLVALGKPALAAGLGLSEQLRDDLPGLRLSLDYSNAGLKAQLKRAAGSGANYALIIGDDELADRTVALKPMAEEGVQQKLKWTELPGALERLLATK